MREAIPGQVSCADGLATATLVIRQTLFVTKRLTIVVVVTQGRPTGTPIICGVYDQRLVDASDEVRNNYEEDQCIDQEGVFFGRRDSDSPSSNISRLAPQKYQVGYVRT
jgi:hypothetical protein